jgi:hypothetical protein
VDVPAPRLPSEASRPARGCFRVIGWMAAAALVIMIALYAALLVYLRHRENPPDIAGIARSQPVVSADHAAVSATSAALRALAPDGASWLVPGPTAVSDECYSQQPGEFVAAWTPAICVRTVTAYFFFGGSFRQHMQAWDAALRAAGWYTTGYTLSQLSNFYTAFGHNPGASEPGQTYLATSLPASGPYFRALMGSSAPSVSLGFHLAERPEASPWVVESAASPDPVIAIAWIEKPAVSPEAVQAAAFTRYQFVAAATLTTTYYDAAAAARAPATHPASEACRSGSGTCD